MTLAEAQHRKAIRHRQAQLLNAVALAALTALLFVACTGCLIAECKTAVVDFRLDAVLHRPVMDE